MSTILFTFANFTFILTNKVIVQGGLILISYKPLLKLLIDRDIRKHDLIQLVGLSTPTIAKFSKNEYVSLSVIDKLCAYFNCQPSDLIEYVPDDSSQNNV